MDTSVLISETAVLFLLEGSSSMLSIFLITRVGKVRVSSATVVMTGGVTSGVGVRSGVGKGTV